MLHPLVYRMRTTPGCFYWIIQILSLQFCYISALKVDSLYSIEKLCCTLQGLKARFYSGALCSQSLVQSFITIKWGSQPPPVIPQRILCVNVNFLVPLLSRCPRNAGSWDPEVRTGWRNRFGWELWGLQLLAVWQTSVLHTWL